MTHTVPVAADMLWPDRSHALRAVPAGRRADYEFLRDNHLVDELRWRGYSVEIWETDVAALGARNGRDAACFLEAIPVDFASRTTEWTAAALRDAALHLIEIQLFCLARGAMLRELQADSIQFRAGRPVQVDLLAFGRRSDDAAASFLESFRALYLQPLGLDLDTLSQGGLPSRLEGMAARLSALALSSEAGGTVAEGRDDPQEQGRRKFVADFVRRARPGLLFDLHAGDGRFGRLALASGARSVVGLEPDRAAAEISYEIARAKGLRLLPLVVGGLDPARCRPGDAGAAVLALRPGQGSLPFDERALDDRVAAAMSLAPRGVIECAAAPSLPDAPEVARQAIARRGRILHELTLEAQGEARRAVLIAFERSCAG
ncbi:MAG: class I SAM-dependent methyltransferase [Alphaproteobacteria bacterium]|nr:class I SAM-dependent methyltransferase [Alphaproteobacteria bacterium]